MENAEKLKANRKRNKTVRYLKIDNMKLAEKVEKYVKKITLSEFEDKLSHKLIDKLRGCAGNALYGELNRRIRLITYMPCNHKLCGVCNWSRQKKIRRKYYAWFSINQTICKVLKNANIVYITRSNLEKYLKNGFSLENENVAYELKHLTLTVPHTTDGWRGNRFYFKDIIRAFNQMRKSSEWKHQVFGGEYGVETTKNDSGYHIHIHALLFVGKGTQNRNLLHLSILKMWNKLTIDQNANRKEFTEEHKIGIKKGNQLITDEYIAKLNAKGSTLMTLESIYYQERGKKVYVKELNTEAMMRAVMETISYHFKPKLFNCGEKSYDTEAIVEIMPKVYKLPMYYKFGCLYEEKCLNVKDDSLLEDYDETSEDVDEETGEVLQTHYFITNPLNTYPKGVENEIHIKRRAVIKNLNVQSGREAVQELVNYSIKGGRYV